MRAKCYDLVLNGIELSSGSIRITDPKLQEQNFLIYSVFSKEEAYSKFGYLLDAFRYGAPPHGGMGIGLDRLCMQMVGCDSLRDVIAYPKLQNASEPMTECPAPVDDEQLNELGIGVTATQRRIKAKKLPDSHSGMTSRVLFIRITRQANPCKVLCIR